MMVWKTSLSRSQTQGRKISECCTYQYDSFEGMHFSTHEPMGRSPEEKTFAEQEKELYESIINLKLALLSA
jgi:hypothetical protein